MYLAHSDGLPAQRDPSASFASWSTHDQTPFQLEDVPAVRWFEDADDSITEHIRIDHSSGRSSKSAQDGVHSGDGSDGNHSHPGFAGLLLRPLRWLQSFSTNIRNPPQTSTHDTDDVYDIPEYITKHAPLIHLFSGENFWPCDIAAHLEHVQPFENNHEVGPLDRYNVSTLDQLNEYQSTVFLTSDDNVEDRPDWLMGKANIPSEPDGDRKRKDGSSYPGGKSGAPVTMVVVDKGDGVVDAFYHFFYCYNLGNKVLNVRFGNHVGDWEHMVVRFKDRKPTEVFFSQHIFGQAFTYDAVEKMDERPVGYSATGTHAMYPTAAVHRYILPWGLLHDETDKGPLWDPLQNVHAYYYNTTTRRVHNTNLSPSSPKPWFYFRGRWGDKAYPLTDPRQYVFAGQYHYVNGPTGPIRKNLARKDVCINEGKACEVKKSLDANGTIRLWPSGDVVSDEVARELTSSWDEATTWQDEI